MEAAGDRIAVVKPQSAFFERLGSPGLSELAKTVATIREQGALSIIDCKRGDVIDTMEGYAGAMLGQHSGFGGDAMTVTAYLGFGALRPVLDRAAKCNGAAFVVVRSSNSEGCSVQDARLADGRTVADALADEITAFNTALGDQIGPVGAVVGETVDGIAANVLARLPRSLILAPGVGAQGASLDDVRNNFGTAIGRTLPSVSRSILRHRPSLAALREAIVAIGNKRGGRLNLSNRCNFGRIVKPHADLRPMLFAFPVNPDVKHRAAVLRIGTDHRAGRQR
jgi:orotidine-5'-phosphate decarboxylase